MAMKRDRASGEIVGVILLILIAISAFLVLYFYVMDSNLMMSVPNPHTEIVAWRDENLIWLQHMGGRELKDWEITVNGNLTNQGSVFEMGNKISSLHNRNIDTSLFLFDHFGGDKRLVVNFFFPEIPTSPPPPPVNNPVLYNESPINNSVDVSTGLVNLFILIQDPEGDCFDWSIETSPDIGSSDGSGDTNGTKACSLFGIEYSTTYTWYVNVTDGTYWTRNWYVFTTED